MDNENHISSLESCFNTQIEQLNINRRNIDKISHLIINSQSIEEKKELKRRLANEVKITKINRHNWELSAYWQEEYSKLEFKDERQISTDQIIRVYASHNQNGFEILRKLEIDEIKLSKQIRNSIARDIKLWNYRRIFVKRISTVYEKFNSLLFKINRATKSSKLWKKLNKIWRKSADKMEDRARATVYSIDHIFGKARNYNSMAKASRKSNEVISETWRKCLAIFNLCELKINTICRNHQNHSNYMQKKCESEKKESFNSQSFNTIFFELNTNRNLNKKRKWLKKTHECSREKGAKLDHIINLMPLNWKYRKK